MDKKKIDKVEGIVQTIKCELSRYNATINSPTIIEIDGNEIDISEYLGGKRYNLEASLITGEDLIVPILIYKEYGFFVAKIDSYKFDISARAHPKEEAARLLFDELIQALLGIICRCCEMGETLQPPWYGVDAKEIISFMKNIPMRASESVAIQVLEEN